MVKMIGIEVISFGGQRKANSKHEPSAFGSGLSKAIHQKTTSHNIFSIKHFQN